MQALDPVSENVAETPALPRLSPVNLGECLKMVGLHLHLSNEIMFHKER